MLNPLIISQNKIIILGETRTGKSRLLYRFLWMLADAGYSRQITVIDMAPSLSWSVGGKLVEIGELPRDIRYSTSWTIKPPRLIGRTAAEVLNLARENGEQIRPLLEEYVKNPSPILIINDATIYIHSQEPSLLFSALNLSRSWLITAYQGSVLADDKGTGISLREAEFVDQLRRVSDIIIRMA